MLTLQLNKEVLLVLKRWETEKPNHNPLGLVLERQLNR
jgi:hypothetical protein